MKIAYSLVALLLSFSVFSQNADFLKMKASDPTQIYTSVEGFGGYHVAGSWEHGLGTAVLETGFRGNWGIKRFRIGVLLPTSNVSRETWGLDDVAVDAGYQLHNNSGFYNSTVINVGYSFGAEDNFFAIYDDDKCQTAFANRSCFNTFHVNYVGAIKFSDKLAFYPGVEWFKRSNTKFNVGYVRDSTYGNSDIYTNGLKFSGTVSYDFNAKNFVQLYAAWSFENWNGENGASTELDGFYNGISQKRFNINVKYQHAFGVHAQGYVNLLYKNYSFNLQEESQYCVYPSLIGLQLGVIYYLH